LEIIRRKNVKYVVTYVVKGPIEPITSELTEFFEANSPKAAAEEAVRIIASKHKVSEIANGQPATVQMIDESSPERWKPCPLVGRLHFIRWCGSDSEVHWDGPTDGMHIPFQP
jgi:ribosomal protein L20A (L18A)